MAKKNNNLAAEVGVGAVAAAALALAGGYVLWERMGKDKQAKMKAWVMTTRKDVAKKVAQAKKLSEGEYKHIVDAAVERYGAMANVNKAELVKTAAAMKAEWKRIQAHAKLMAKEMQKSEQSAEASAKKISAKKTSARKQAKK